MMETIWLFLINPSAGNGRAWKQWLALAYYLDADGFPYHLYRSTQPGDMANAVQVACEEGRERVVVIGGDGSMHEAVNGLLTWKSNGRSLPVLGHFPAGSGNDWATYWRIPRNPKRWWQEAKKWPTQTHNAGFIEFDKEGSSGQRYFLNVAGLAYDAFVVKQIEANPGAKGNPFIYILSVMRWLFTYTPQRAEVQASGRKWSGRFYTINAGVCPYSGGGMRVVPHALPDRNTLAFTIAGDLPISRILLNIWRFYNGSIGSVKDVELVHGVELKVQSRDEKPIWIEADGEWLGQCPCKISLIPSAFQVFAPAR